MDGYLGGLQLQNLVADQHRHKKVFSVGLDPSAETAGMFQEEGVVAGWTMPSEGMAAAQESLLVETSSHKAFTFTFSKGSEIRSLDGQSPLSSPVHKVQPTYVPDDDGEVVLTLRMASLCYTHSPAFLQDLSNCLTEFKDYMSQVGSSIKSAATEVAMGLVNKRTDTAGSLYGSNLSLDATPGGTRGRRAPSLSEMAGDTSLDMGQSIEEPEEESSQFNLHLDAILQTPVIILPRTPTSSEVLVSHLGRISLRNFDLPVDPPSFSLASPRLAPDSSSKKLFVEIRDMSMYSVDLDKQKSLEKLTAKSGKAAMGTSVFHTPQPGGSVKASYGTPILHNTVIEFTLQKLQEEMSIMNTDTIDLTLGDDFMARGRNSMERDTDAPRVQTSSVMHVKGRVVNPLKVALGKQVYEQVLHTLDNITPEDVPINQPQNPDISIEEAPSGSVLADISEEGEHSTIHPSVSALKLDTVQVPRRMSRTLSRTSDCSGLDTTSAVKVDVIEHMAVRAYFELPDLNIKVLGEIGEGDQGVVDIQLHDFKLNFQKNDPWSKDIEISLQSLMIEDLLQDAKSKHRHLMVSHATARPGVHSKSRHLAGEGNTSQYLSQSCPSHMIDVPSPELPPSLPSSFHQENVFYTTSQKTQPVLTPKKRKQRFSIQSSMNSKTVVMLQVMLF